MTVDIIQYTDTQVRAVKNPRKRQYISKPAQLLANDKNARIYVQQLLNTNFSELGGYHVTMTYKEERKPELLEDAIKDRTNYLRRVSAACKAKGCSPPVYFAVTEYGEKGKSNKLGRVHHHVVIRCGLSRDELEALWSYRAKGKSEMIGRCNSDRLQLDKDGLQALANYLCKRPEGRRRYTCSRNIKRPYQTRNDNKYSSKQLQKIVRLVDEYRAREFIEKKYPGWQFVSAETSVNEVTGKDSVSIRLYKPPSGNSRSKRQSALSNEKNIYSKQEETNGRFRTDQL